MLTFVKRSCTPDSVEFPAQAPSSSQTPAISHSQLAAHRWLFRLAIVPLGIGVGLTNPLQSVTASAAKPSGTAKPKFAQPDSGSTVLLRGNYQGGFTMAGTDARSVPAFVLTTNGRLFRPGVMTEQFPGAALNPVTIAKLSKNDLAKVTKLATAANLTKKLDLGLPPTADVPEFQITFQGTTNIVASLGVGDDTLPAAQANGRKKLVALLEFLNTRTGENVYAPTALVLEVAQYDETNIDPSVRQTPKRWPPEASELKEMGGCKALVGSKAKAALATLTKANQLTPFTSGGQTYRVFARPMLPGDRGCSSL